ncbi:MAG: hypothetical protein ACYTHN_11080 [Planctomycetota bacterium]|jgi:hypothetical protein
MRSMKILWLALLVFGLLFVGCEKDEDDPLPPPVPPTYPPADVQDLINHDGGSGGGPNMGTFNVVLFDKDDPQTRLQGATVIVYHGGLQEDSDVTGQHGEAVFTGITPGAVTVTAVMTGYVNMTLVDVNAATVVLGLEGRFLRVTGQIQGFGGGSHVEVELETKVFNELDRTWSEKYGRVTNLQLAGGRYDFDIRFKAGATDRMIVKEVDDTVNPGRILKRYTQTLGPWYADYSFPGTVNLPASVDLHEINLGVQGVPFNVGILFVGVVTAYYEDPATRYRYWSYQSTFGAGTWNVNLQMPADLTSPVTVVIEAYAAGDVPGADLPMMSLNHPVTTGGAGGSTGSLASMSMVSLSGDFQNPQHYGDLFLVLAKYFGRLHMAVGFQNAGNDYIIQVPSGLSVQILVFEVHPLVDDAAEIVAYMDQNVPGDTVDRVINFNLGTAGTSTLDITTNIPAGIIVPEGLAILTGPDGSGTFMPIPFMGAGYEQNNQIRIPLRYGAVSGVTTYMLAIMAREAGVPEGEGGQSMFIRGNLSDPTTTLGSSPVLTLLDIPEALAPAEGTTVPRSTLHFAWFGDASLETEGANTISIRDDDDATVWTIIVRGSTTQFTLPALPTGLDQTVYLNYPAPMDYSYSVSSIWMQGMDIDNFYVDSFPDEMDQAVNLDEVWKLADSRDITFRVN